MSDSTAAPGSRPNRWRNPLFLLVFVVASAASSAVVGWLVWLSFHPVRDWVGRQHELLQEFLTTLLIALVAGVVAGGFVVVVGVATTAAGIRPVLAQGQTHGKHAGWTPPGRG
jgi:ABC-type Fe3+ transport system permease subunit